METSKIWKNKTLPNVELLSATYTDFQFSKHWHDELAIGVIERGAEGLLYQGENLVVPENKIVAINPGEIHTGSAAATHGWQYRMFYFDLATIAKQFEFINLTVDPVVNQSIIDNPTLFNELLVLHQSLENSSFELTKESLMALVFEKLFTNYGTVKTIDNTNHVDKNSAYLARDFMVTHWNENLSLTTLERVCDCSKFQLIRSFKAVFGITPHQFLLIIKANKSKQLLSQGLSCVDTSLACGFYDQSHFNRNFKRAFGITPSKYIHI